MTAVAAAMSRVGGRVAELQGDRLIEIVDHPVPRPGPGETLVRIAKVGICGTDLHAFRGRYDRLPITLGHDAVGTVEQTSDESTLPAGQRVTIDPMMSCDVCPVCLAGRRHLCPNGGYLGMTEPGTMAEFLVVPSRRLVPLPDGFDAVDATVLEPITVALHLLRRTGGLTVGMQAAEVVGGGPLGVLLAQTLAGAGWQVRVHEPIAYRRDLAEAAGVKAVDSALAAEPTPACLVVETSASGPGLRRASELAGAGSVIGLVGRAPDDVASADILLKELSVLGVKSGVDQYEAAIGLVVDGTVTPRAVVSHEFDFADIGHAMRSVDDPSAEVMRAVLHLDS